MQIKKNRTYARAMKLRKKEAYRVVKNVENQLSYEGLQVC